MSILESLESLTLRHRIILQPALAYAFNVTFPPLHITLDIMKQFVKSSVKVVLILNTFNSSYLAPIAEKNRVVYLLELK